MNMIDSKWKRPTGWLMFYLILALAGGLLFILTGILFFFSSYILGGMGTLVGGLVMEICALKAVHAFRKFLPTALSFSRLYIAAFFVTSLFILYNLTLFYMTTVLILIVFVGIVWCAIWWLYLSLSKQVRELGGTRPEKSRGGILTVLLLTMLLLILGAFFYAGYYREQANYYRMVLEQKRAHPEPTEVVEEYEEPQETEESQGIEVEEVVVPKQARTVSSGKIDAGNLSFVLPRGWEYKKDGDGVFDIYADGRMFFTLIPNLNNDDLRSVGLLDMFEEHLRAWDVKSFKLAKAPLYKYEKNSIMGFIYDVQLVDDGMYVSELYQISQAYGTEACLIMSVTHDPDDDRIRKFAESIKFK